MINNIFLKNDFKKINIDLEKLKKIAQKFRSIWPMKLKPRLYWGPVPIITNKYWSRAMSDSGYASKTIVNEFYSSINAESDFDEYLGEKQKKHIGLFISSKKEKFAQFLYLLEHFDIFHLPLTGCILGEIGLFAVESEILKMAGKKIIILPYGSDAYAYDKVENLSLRNALLTSYPDKGREALEINSRIAFYSKNADIIIPGFMSELFPYWNVVSTSPATINTVEWKVSNKQHKESKVVKVVHTPNHRGFKGSEFVIEACQQLQNEGYSLELILIERKQNTEVRKIFQEEAHILVEQIIADGYALSAIEGMSCGLAVLSNLSNKNLCNMFRRYSYLSECPILSTAPETVYKQLKTLLNNPSLIEKLGVAGRSYVEKYHSNKTAQYMFEKIYDSFNGAQVDLINLFHPILGEYNKSLPLVKHPLVDNLISE